MAGELVRSIRSSIAEKPRLIHLLDSLLEVASSSRPDIKLLTALAKDMPETVQKPTKPKTVALASPTPVLSAPVSQNKTATANPPIKQGVKPAPKLETQSSKPVEASPFEWDKVLEHVQAHYIAIYSVLSKCTPMAEEDTLTLYTGNSFYKKKLDDIRYRTNIMLSLEALGMGGLTIETVGASAPPKDSTVAAVAALMGGGEEYTIEENGNEK